MTEPTRPSHWIKVELPEDNGDPRLLDACWALMDVRAKPPAGEHYIHDLPVLDLDPDLNDLPIDHTQGTENDPITQVAVVRLAKAVLAVADRYAECKRLNPKRGHLSGLWNGWRNLQDSKVGTARSRAYLTIEQHVNLLAANIMDKIHWDFPEIPLGSNWRDWAFVKSQTRAQVNKIVSYGGDPNALELLFVEIEDGRLRIRISTALPRGGPSVDLTPEDFKKRDTESHG